MEYINQRRDRQRRLDREAWDDWLAEEEEAERLVVHRPRHLIMHRRDPLTFWDSEAFFELFR